MVCLLYLVSTIFAMLSSAEGGLPANAAAPVRKASRRTDTCNVVIFGETGAGKSSLVNLITRDRKSVEISPDATGRTAVTTMHDADIPIGNNSLGVKLFDTPGLGEGSVGTVPAEEAERILKKLFRELKEQDGIHLLIYCVRCIRKATTLRRSYDLFQPKMKDVPIVLVVTGLENQEPNMEEWWTRNENFLSDQQMTFTGHACITAVTLRDDDSTKLKERRKESYLAVCRLIEQRRLPSGKGVHGYIGDYRAIDHPRNVIVCDSAIPAPMSVYNVAGVTSDACIRFTVEIRGQYFMFQRVTAPYPPEARSKRGIGFKPHLLIFYVDRNLPADSQKEKVQEFCKLYAKKFNVDLVVVVYGSDSDEDANSWWNKLSVDRGPLFESSITFRLTCLPRDASGCPDASQEALQELILELSRPGESRGRNRRRLGTSK